jgi:uncharacterized membrane protein
VPAITTIDGGGPAADRLRSATEGAFVSDLIAIAYADLNTARQVAANVGEAQKAHLISLEDLVVVERKGDGNIKLHQPSMTGAGAAGGALWGGLIGLIFFVPLFGMAIGAATGAIAGRMADPGVDDQFMKKLGESLQPGAAALILLVREANTEKLLSQVKIPGAIIQTSLSSEAEEQLRAALEAAGTR